MCVSAVRESAVYVYACVCVDEHKCVSVHVVSVFVNVCIYGYSMCIYINVCLQS